MSNHISDKNIGDKKMENDVKWRIFVTKRAEKMAKHQKNIDKIREDLKKVMNPFSQELVVEVSIRLSPTATILDETGIPIPASTEIEKDKSTKLYKSAEKRDRTMNLSATAMRMLLFIMYEVEGSDDWIELNPEWYKEASKAGSRNMYKKAKDELVRYGYISRTEHKNIYWINPALMFSGNRVEKYPEQVIVKNTFTGKEPVKRRRKTVENVGLQLGKKRTYQADRSEIEQMEQEYRKDKENKNDKTI